MFPRTGSAHSLVPEPPSRQNEILPHPISPGVVPPAGRRATRLILLGFALCLGVFLGAGAVRASEGDPSSSGGAAPSVEGEQASGAIGVEWRELTLDQALQEAAAQEAQVLVDVWATHCHACGDMDEQVWATSEGVALAEGTIPIKIDTQSPAGQEFMKRYPVTGLPAIIYLNADGTEFDRVQGYIQREQFLREARLIHDGIDGLLTLEAQLQKNPNHGPVLLDALERYLFRQRLADADSAYARVLRLDPDNAQGLAERAIRHRARFEESFTRDYAKAAEYHKLVVERFPKSSSAGGSVDGVLKALLRAGRSREWPEWACDLAQRNPDAPSIQRGVAITALHNGFRDPCFAEAARSAGRLGLGKPAFMDSIAVILQGGTGDGR